MANYPVWTNWSTITVYSTNTAAYAQQLTGVATRALNEVQRFSARLAASVRVSAALSALAGPGPVPLWVPAPACLEAGGARRAASWRPARLSGFARLDGRRPIRGLR